jgi:hypothetical protein
VSEVENAFDCGRPVGEKLRSAPLYTILENKKILSIFYAKQNIDHIK